MKRSVVAMVFLALMVGTTGCQKYRLSADADADKQELSGKIDRLPDVLLKDSVWMNEIKAEVKKSLLADSAFKTSLKEEFKKDLLQDPVFLAELCAKCEELKCAKKVATKTKIRPLKPRSKSAAAITTFAGDKKAPAAAQAPPCPKPSCDTNIPKVPEGTAPVFAGDHNQK